MPGEDKDTQIKYGSAIMTLWRNWAISVALIMVMVTFRLWLPYRWMPIVVFSLELAVYAMVRRNREADVPVCYLLPFVMTRVLFWTGVIMVALNLMEACGVHDRIFESHQPDAPFIPALVVGPVTVLVTLWATLLNHRIGFCIDCRMRHGTPAERGFLGALFSQEGMLQVRTLLVISSGMTAACAVFYFVSYHDAGFSSADLFFFIWLPIIFCGVSAVYMAARYLGLWAYYSHNAPLLEFGRPSSTTVRFLVFTADKILLTDKTDTLGETDSDSLYDTPATLYFSYKRKPPLHDDRRYFRDLSGINDFDLRFMYLSHVTGSGSVVFHYIVTLDCEEAAEGSRLKGEWLGLKQVETMLNSGRLNPMLSAEIYRLYTVTMAWKTYDRTGRRRYAIKSYRPTFHLGDITNREIDYDDPNWLYVATNNQDSRFYLLKRFWHRYINGIRE